MPLPGVNIDTSLLGQNGNFSAGTDLGSKIGFDSLKSTASAGIDKLTNAVKGIFGARPTGLQIPTSFPSKNMAPSSVPPAANTAPPEFKKPNSVLGSALVYPAYQKYFTTFTFYQYIRANASDVARNTPTVSIVLPLPQNISEQFNASYDEPSMGTIVGTLNDSVLNSIRRNQGAGENFNRTASGTATALVGAGLLNALSGVPKFGEAAAAAGKLAAGATPNPYIAVVFRNIELRTHQFQYRFAPRSLQELQTVKQIIRHLKTRMLPGTTEGSQVLFTFPDTCEISYKNGDQSFDYIKLKTCVLKDLSINYSPNGPAFFKTGDPAIIDISMTFREIAPFTRMDSEKGYSFENRTFKPPAKPLPGKPVDAPPGGQNTMDHETAAAQALGEGVGSVAQ